MASIDESLRHVVLKIKRAKEHAAELQRQLRSFLDAKPYKGGYKQDPTT